MLVRKGELLLLLLQIYRKRRRHEPQTQTLLFTRRLVYLCINSQRSNSFGRLPHDPVPGSNMKRSSSSFVGYRLQILKLPTLDHGCGSDAPIRARERNALHPSNSVHGSFDSVAERPTCPPGAPRPCRLLTASVLTPSRPQKSFLYLLLP